MLLFTSNLFAVIVGILCRSERLESRNLEDEEEHDGNCFNHDGYSNCNQAATSKHMYIFVGSETHKSCSTEKSSTANVDDNIEDDDTDEYQLRNLSTYFFDNKYHKNGEGNDTAQAQNSSTGINLKIDYDLARITITYDSHFGNSIQGAEYNQALQTHHQMQGLRGFEEVVWVIVGIPCCPREDANGLAIP